MLREAQNAGAEIKTESFVSEIKEDHVIVDGTEISYDYIEGADGTNSIVRRDLEVFVDDFKTCLKYDWIFPHRSFTSVGMGGSAGNGRMLRQSLDDMCYKHNIEKTKFEAAHINFDYRGFIFGNKILSGDAAGFASGLTGEGIYQAILSGEEAAKGIIDRKYGIF